MIAISVTSFVLIILGTGLVAAGGVIALFQYLERRALRQLVEAMIAGFGGNTPPAAPAPIPPENVKRILFDSPGEAAVYAHAVEAPAWTEEARL